MPFTGQSGTIVKRGLASVSGVVGLFDVIIYPVAQSGKLTESYDKEVIKNVKGSDVSALGRNETYAGDFAMKLLGDTDTHAKAGAALLAPLAVVTLSGFEVAAFNGAYTVEPGGSIDLGNTKVGDIEFKLMRYTDADQNTLMTSIPG